MIVPKYLDDGDIVGVTACSCGVLDKIDKYENSIRLFYEHNLEIKETNNVRTSGMVSSDTFTRVKELEELVLDDSVSMIEIASGGDFLYDILPYVNYDAISKHVKWFGGSSDPTSLLFTITTNLDIATIYTPCNMSGFHNHHQSYLDYFEILKGNLVKQYRSDTYESDDDIFDLPNEWNTFGEDINQSGILLGGCIECLKDVIGTNFDKTVEFIQKYKDEGIIWYFDVFSMSSEDLYRTLLQFQNAGWFAYTKLIVIGKVRFPSSFTELSYENAVKNVLKDYQVIYKFDVGHVKPSMTMINGFKVRIVSNEKEGSLEYIK